MTEITIASAFACYFSREAREVPDERASGSPIEIRDVDIVSAEGQRIVERFRPPMPPAVLVRGAPFSFGRLPGKKPKRHPGRAA